MPSRTEPSHAPGEPGQGTTAGGAAAGGEAEARGAGAAEALRHSEDRLRLALHAGRLGIWEWEISSDELYWSPETFEIFGMPPSDGRVRRQDFAEMLHPDDASRLWRIVERALATGERFDAEFRIVRSDGVERWLASHATVQRDATGRAVRLLGTVADVTAGKELEHALRDSEARFRELADAMPQIVWTARPDGVVDYYNRRWYELTGAEPGVGDDSWLPVLHPDDRQHCLDVWYGCVRSGEPYEIEYRFLFPPRDYRWHLGRALPVRDPAGHIVRWYGTSTDIHDRREAEARLREADRRKDEFISVLAHELRNPLGPIRHATEIIRLAEGDPERIRRAREVVERQVTHMARMVDDLLDVSRSVQGRVQLRPEACELGTIIRQTADDHRAPLEAAGIALRLSLPPGEVPVRGDPVRLAQILSNVLHNAAKFTDAGGRVAVSLATEESGTAVVRIHDTGIGIDRDMLQRLFEPFAQAERSLDRTRGGLGLGLALARALVELHGGTIVARSDGLGRGTEIEIRLPCAAPAAAAGAAADPAAQVPRRRVLVIEDNRDAAESLELALQLSGHEVRVAYAGDEGLHVARTFRPDVVLCDIGLPGALDGYAVGAALRAEKATLGEPPFLIALTGYGQPEDQRRALEAGFDVHLVKPLDLATLEVMLAQPLRGAPGAPEESGAARAARKPAGG